jgi:hypothetical protein
MITVSAVCGNITSMIKMEVSAWNLYKQWHVQCSPVQSGAKHDGHSEEGFTVLSSARLWAHQTIS